MLDVVTSQKASREKGTKEKLKITNELKIITIPDNVYNQWSEVISSATHGELINSDTQMKFKQKTGWKSENDMLIHKFFKWSNNLSYDNLPQLAMHIPHQSPKKEKEK